jgi:1-deoxy-D-xylulose-5-phosphate reductoisomerase
VTARRTIVILGATGSVGRSTLDLVERDRDRFEVLALTANSDVAGLAEAARRVGARRAVIARESGLEPLRAALEGSGIETAAGEQAVLEAAACGADWTMAAIVGAAGLRPTMAALGGGGTVALANKEALVSAGEIMMEAARAGGATLLPVDSEHNAIFQCLEGNRAADVRRIILTASGGPFLRLALDHMRGVTPAQAVAHPNWSMGAKISVDSATLMNKGLELIEAFHLFPLPAEAFEVVIHPQSVVHSLVDYRDGSVLAQLGAPDMRVPIAYTLAWPDRMETPCERLDLARLARLDFEAPDEARFPALAVAKAALKAGGARPAILNAANEAAVGAFLEGGIGFLDIASTVAETLQCCDCPAAASVDDVMAIDASARASAREIMKRYQR